MTIKRLLALLLLPVVLMTTGAGCFGGTSTTASEEKITLKMWGVFDEEAAYKSIFSAYSVLHPNITFQYKKFRPEEFEAALVKAIAEGTGPDIFEVHNTGIGAYKELLKPLPSSLTVTYLETQGTLRKVTSLVTKQEPTLSQTAYKQQFVDVAAEDLFMDYQPDPKVDAVKSIYAVPFYVDTLALFYNKDLLNAAGVAVAPSTWEDFIAAVKKLTKIDATGTIIQSGAALGTTANVQRSSDILSVLMMQNGTQMTDERGRVTFDSIPKGTPSGVNPGLDAVTFYTDFANPTKEDYTWNAAFPDSLEAFSNGQTAFFLGYSYDIPLIESAAPKLNYAIAPLPQISGGKSVNYANYWAYGVSKTSKAADYAWNFLLYATSPDNVNNYLTAASRPTASRSLISSQLEDEQLGVFAGQLLTAETWYHGQDEAAMEKAINDLANTILVGTDKPADVMRQAVSVVSQTY